MMKSLFNYPHSVDELRLLFIEVLLTLATRVLEVAQNMACSNVIRQCAASSLSLLFSFNFYANAIKMGGKT